MRGVGRAGSFLRAPGPCRALPSCETKSDVAGSLVAVCCDGKPKGIKRSKVRFVRPDPAIPSERRYDLYFLVFVVGVILAAEAHDAIVSI